MIRNFLATLFILVFAVSGTAMATESVGSTGACKDVSLMSLRAHVPIPPARIISKRTVNGLCEVILGIKGELVPVYVGKGYVIAGEMFQDRTQVTQAQLNRLKAERFLSLLPEVEKSVAFTLKPKGSVKHTVYIITDPVCPFCHRAESKLQEFADKYGVQFKLILYSVHLPVGRQKAVEAVCRKLDASSYLDGKWKQENATGKYQCKAGDDLIKRTERLVRKLGIRGVPMFYLSDGTLIQGANMPALARALSRGKTRVSYSR